MRRVAPRLPHPGAGPFSTCGSWLPPPPYGAPFCCLSSITPPMNPYPGTGKEVGLRAGDGDGWLEAWIRKWLSRRLRMRLHDPRSPQLFLGSYLFNIV